MALAAKVVSFLLPDGVAGTTLAVTGVGFQPKAIIFFWGGSTSGVDVAVQGNSRFGIGFAASPTDRRCVGSFSNDNESTTDTAVSMREDHCVVSNAGGGVGDNGRWDLQSMDGDGFTIVVDLDAPSAAASRVHALCLGGADITNVAGGGFDGSGAAGDQDVTTVGFQPDIVFFLASGSSTSIPQADVTARLCLGLAAPSGQGVVTVASENAAGTSNTVRYGTNADCLLLVNSSAGIAGRASFVSMLSNGFRINWSTATGRRSEFLAIKGGGWFVGDLLTNTSLTTVVESGFGFTPKGVFVGSHCGVQSTAGVLQDNLCLSLGAGDSPTSRGAHGGNEPDNLGTSAVWLGVEYDEVYQNLFGGAGVVGLMDIQSFNVDGITFVMDDADPAARFASYVAMGDTPVAPAGPGPNALMLLGVGQ